MYDFSLSHGIGPGERNDRHDLAGFARSSNGRPGSTPGCPMPGRWRPSRKPIRPDGYMPGFGGAVRGFQILAGLDPDGVARSGGPTEKALAASLDPNRAAGPSTPMKSIAAHRRGPQRHPAIPGGRRRKGGRENPELSRQTAGPGATGAGKGGSGANRRPPVPTVPPPGIRRSVGAGRRQRPWRSAPGPAQPGPPRLHAADRRDRRARRRPRRGAERPARLSAGQGPQGRRVDEPGRRDRKGGAPPDRQTAKTADRTGRGGRGRGSGQTVRRRLVWQCRRHRRPGERRRPHPSAPA